MLAAVLIVTALASLRCLGNNFVSDDESYILTNHYIGQWSFAWKAFYLDAAWFRNPQAHVTVFYRPVWLEWYWLNYWLFGANPVGWHVTQILLYLVAVWLVYKIAERLTGEFESALVAAALFGLLPVHADSLAWPSGVDLPLVGTLELAAFYQFVTSGSSSSHGLGSCYTPARSCRTRAL